MNQESTQALRALLLPGYGVLRIAGADAQAFLQGQFTNDVRLLADGRTQVSACCTNQGRVLALVRFRQTEEAIYALLPSDLIGEARDAPAQVRAPFPGRNPAGRGPARRRHRARRSGLACASWVRRGRDDPLARANVRQHRGRHVPVCAGPRGRGRARCGLACDQRPFAGPAQRTGAAGMARGGHRRRPAAGVRGDVRTLHAADAQRRPRRRRELHQGLLHRAGNHRPHPSPRPREAARAAFRVATRRASCATGESLARWRRKPRTC